MKQRLINSDEAKAQIIEDKIPENYMSIMRATGSGLQAETLNQACDRHIKMLDELQAVEAVPIEWIEKWSMQNQSMNFGNGRNAIIKLFKVFNLFYLPL